MENDMDATISREARRADATAARRGERERWSGEHVVGDGSSMLLLPTHFAASANP